MDCIVHNFEGVFFIGLNPAGLRLIGLPSVLDIRRARLKWRERNAGLMRGVNSST